uniref:Uncharacterized protein n=1 Tax=Rhipicephalus zambeziensis TaxID=60191 RepID=A0A224YAF6_9ACAR
MPRRQIENSAPVLPLVHTERFKACIVAPPICVFSVLHYVSLPLVLLLRQAAKKATSFQASRATSMHVKLRKPSSVELCQYISLVRRFLPTSMCSTGSSRCVSRCFL